MSYNSLLFKYLDAINWSKKNYLKDPNCEEALRFKKEYLPFQINTYLGGSDSLFLANEVNTTPKMSAERQFVFLLGTVRVRKRFVKWPKKTATDEMVEAISIYYDVSIKKAREYLLVHTKEQLDIIKQETEDLFVKRKRT